MSILPHVTTGAVVGSFLPNAPLAALGGIGSHLVVDLIPHWDPKLNRSIPLWRKITYAFLLLIDLSLSLTLLWFLSPFPNMFWGGLLGGLTDLDNFLHWLEKIGIKTHVKKSGWQNKTNIFLGLVNQTIVTGIGLIILFLRVNKLGYNF